MIALPLQIRVFLYRQPTDMRNYAVQTFMRSWFAADISGR